MLRGFCRALSIMSRDPAFTAFLSECTSTIATVKVDPSRHLASVRAAVSLLEDDNTVPFIARYRREQTGELTASDLYELQRRWEEFQTMAKLRNSRLAALDASGRLTEDIRARFYECTNKEELDEVYSSYKENKTAKSEVIAAYQVDEVAHDLLEGKLKSTTISEHATKIAKESKYTVGEAIVYHCTNHIYADADVKESAKQQFGKFPAFVTTHLTTAYKALQADKQASGSSGGAAKPAAKSEKGEKAPQWSELNKYKDYHSVHRRVSQLAAHQLLAIRRGKDAGVLSVALSADDIAKQNVLRFIQQKYKCFPSANDVDPAAVLKLTAPGSRIHRQDVLTLASKEAVSKLGAAAAKKQWRDAMTAAEVAAADVFSTSLRPLLLTAPLRMVVDGLRSARHSHSDSGGTTATPIVVCAVDPGFAHGHKWVILSQGPTKGGQQSTAHSVRAQGEDTTILCYGKIFEKPGNSGNSGRSFTGAQHSSPLMLHSAAQLGELLTQYGVDVVAIGNGTASREAQLFVATALSQSGGGHGSKQGSGGSAAVAGDKGRQGCLGYVVVSEAGASVYSASDRARQEFPPEVLDIAYVGAVSIGRRLLDPLSELVKVQPASLGVGMYQHDLTDKGISERLRNVVEDCVNTVGVDVNTASSDLLRYISGLSEANVWEILAYRSGCDASADSTAAKGKAKSKKTVADADGKTSGRFGSLEDLRGVKGIGPKTFRNCAGFLRVYSGTEPLDVTNIHPEDYPVARAILELYRSGRLGAADRQGGGDDSTGRKKQKGSSKGAVPSANCSVAGAIIPASVWAKLSSSGGSSGADAGTVQDVAPGKKRKAASGSGSEEAQLALLRTKTAAELEQLWLWLLEGGIVPNADSAVATGTGANNGPYVSVPKLLQGVPSDFHQKVEVGSIVDGVIRNVTTFGAFVDLGGVELGAAAAAGGKSRGGGAVTSDGLLHCSKYREYLQRTACKGGVADMAKEIYVGRQVRVKIGSIGEAEGGKGGHHEKRRIGLDLVELL